MHKFRKIGTWISLALLLSLLAVGFTPVQAVQAQNGSSVVYNLFATDGFVRMADGAMSYIYGFVGGRANPPTTAPVMVDVFTSLLAKKAPESIIHVALPNPQAGPVTAAEALLAGNAQFPAPMIVAAVGDVVEIRLKNLGVTANPKAPNDPHSIHLHGLDVDAANDGVPETSLGAIPANAALPGAGNVVVYMFTPTMPGTYMYHCHQEASIHVAMGMYGALIVYNQGDAGAVGVEDTPGDWRYGPGIGGGSLYGWNYDKEYVLLLSDMDLNQNKAEQQAVAWNNTLYRPQYWFINGLSFPSTLHVPPPGAPVTFANGKGWWENWIEAHHGYDPFIIGKVANAAAGTPGQKVLLRMINMGFQSHPMHMHGFHGTIIGSDQRGWNFTQGQMEKNTLLIGSGETYEWLLDFGKQSLQSVYQPGVQSRYNPANRQPVVNTDPNFPAIPDPFAPGKAYIGGPQVGPLNQANQGPGGLPAELPYIAGQYFPFHNHNDYQATNNGVYPGGMFTMIMTTP